MALVVKDRVRQVTTTAGTGTLTLGGTVTGFQSFSVIGNGNTTYYAIVDGATGEWEVGIGTYTSSGTTLSRDTVLESSNSNNLVSFAAGTKDVFCTYPADRSVTSDYLNTFTVPQVISVNSSSDALRITQVGSGNAFVVEDSANPDATPFVVDANGRVVVGHTSALAATGGIPNIQYVGGAVPFGNFGFASTAAIGAFTFARSKSATIGTNAALVAGDQIGVFRFQGADGVSAYLDGAQIIAAADGSFSATSSPGRLVFSTTADGASSPTERMRIDAAGNVGIGTGTITGVTLRVNKNITGATSSFGVYAPPAIQSDVTTGVQVFGTFPSIVDSAFTLNSLNHFFASQGTKGASATLTNQYGFVASSTLTGATNNYGFYSNIASGTGRWNFYAGGTADNYFAGSVGIGGTPLAGFKVSNYGNLSGATTAYSYYGGSTFQSDVTTQGIGFGTFLGTQAASFTLTTLSHFRSAQGTFGAGSTVTNQFGFEAPNSLTGATNNYGFYSNIASGTGRWNFYANGTAANFFTGNVLIGTATDRGGAFQVTGTSTTAAATTQRITGFAFDSRLRLSRANASETVVASGDSIGILAFDGYDGATYVPAAQILAAVDGTPGTNDMPGRLVFSTTADGASSPTERMRIDSAGNVGIGGIAAATTKLFLGGTQPSSSNITFVVTAGGTIPSTTTSTAQYFRSVPTTEAASFTLTNLQHYYAAQGTFGASSTVTSQFGFFADSMTGATNNYGFYSNIASGTGRWNFYANGTAENYLGGNLKIGGTAARATTAGTNQLVLFDGTAPVGTLANGVSFYSAAGEARVMDAAGNSTLLSPHDSATNEWIFHSKHTPTGKVLRIDVEKMLRFINDHFGLDMIQEFTEE